MHYAYIYIYNAIYISVEPISMSLHRIFSHVSMYVLGVLCSRNEGCTGSRERQPMSLHKVVAVVSSLIHSTPGCKMKVLSL